MLYPMGNTIKLYIYYHNCKFILNKVYKRYSFKLNPTKEQKILMERHFGACRLVYNYFLNFKQMLWEENIHIGYFETTKILTIFKKSPENIWLKDICSDSLEHSLKILDQAYRNFFNKLTEFPKFKKRSNRKTFAVRQHLKVENNKIYFGKFREGVTITLSQPIKGVIKQATIIKTPSNKYEVAVLVEESIQALPKTGKQVGIDFGLKDLVITSDNEIFKAHKFYIQYQKELSKADKDLSRKQKGSHSYEKQRIKAARIHAKIANCRKDLAHKIALYLVKNYDLIVLENLSIQNMVKNKKLSKAISDAGWGLIKQFITYKADWYGKELIKIDRFFPSSRLCNVCSYKNKDLKLSDRSWDCPQCNTHHDRDFNAAQNILNEGLRIKESLKNTSAGTVDYKSGDDVRPVPAGSCL